MNKETAKSSGHKSSSKLHQTHSNSTNQKDIPMIKKKVRISQEKLLSFTRKAYNNSGADNKCEAKSLHLLCRAVNAQLLQSNTNSQTLNSLCTLQSKVDDKFNPASEAWKHAFILVISFLKNYQMELSLATVIVETPKEIEVRNYNSPGIIKIPFPISMKHFTSSESVSRIFNDLMRTKKSIQNKTFTDKLDEFIEDMEMEDFWQRNPLIVFSSSCTNTLSTAQKERSSAATEKQQVSSSMINKSNIQSSADEITNNDNEDEYSKKDQISSDNRKILKKKKLSSSSSKKGIKKKKKGKKKE